MIPGETKRNESQQDSVKDLPTGLGHIPLQERVSWMSQFSALESLV
jgi:hypothetical protein